MPDIDQIRKRLSAIDDEAVESTEFTASDARAFLKMARDLLAIVDKSHDHRRYASYLRVRDHLRRTYAEVFDHDNPLPLKLSIRRDLFRVLDGEFSHVQVHAFLSIWTKRFEYRRALERATCRYDLNGDRHPLRKEPVEPPCDTETAA